MPASDDVCPSADRLRAWSQGRVSAAELEAVGAHVSRCAACEAVLDRLDGETDSVVDGLRRGRPDPEPAGLARIALQAPLGRGGMGVVHKAWHRALKTHVAVKLLPPHRRGDVRAAARFRREMEAAGRLVHENLVRALDAGEAKGRPYLVMEYLDGEDLQALVRRRGPLPVAEACDLVRQAARGLGHAHAHGLVHRDVKPSNLMSTTGGTVKVLDLGLARIVDDEEPRPDGTAAPSAAETVAGGPLTRTAQMVGTADYVAPEQTTDAREADARTDVYALGCTLYFLLAGRAPFETEEHATFRAKLRAHCEEAPEPVEALRPDVPPTLAGLVARMLAKDPARRPQTMEEVVALLEAEAVLREGFAEPRRRERYLFVVRRPGKRLVALLLLGVVLAGAALHANRGNLASAWSAARRTLAERLAVRPAPVVPRPSANPPSTARSVPVRRPTPPKASSGIAQRSPPVTPGPASAPDPVAKDAPPVVVDALDPDGLFDAVRPRSAAEARAAQRQWAERLGQSVEETNSIGMRLALVPPGRYLMGSTDADPAAAEDERPQLPATISAPFRIALHETTQSQWGAVMKTTPWMKSSLPRYYARKGPDLPATYVSWGAAEDFCRRLTDRERKAGRLAAEQEYALPSEAQWEYACRAGTTTAYSFGDDPAELGRHAWYGGLEGDGNAAKERFAHRVGGRLPNPWGLFDVHGNAWEWCRDEYDAVRHGGTDPIRLGPGGNRVLRGGGWDAGPDAARSANRMPCDTPGNGRRGFRVVVVPVRPAAP